MLFDTKKNEKIYANSRLGAAIYNSDISVGLAAKILGVSRQTVYAWFDANVGITYQNGIKRQIFCQALEELQKENRLPCSKRNRDIADMVRARISKLEKDYSALTDAA